jgi:hypothetical protein
MVTYLECPRKFFYRYVLGWTSDNISQDLHFGQCVHLALEYIYSQKSFDETVIDTAYDIFLNKYRNQHHFKFQPDSDEYYSPKNPERFKIFLDFYAQKNSEIFDKYNVLFTEVAGSIPLFAGDEDFFSNIIFKIDAIIQEKETGLIYGLEHKTAKNLSEIWATNHEIGIQISTYTHALKTYFEIYKKQRVGGIIINGLGFRKLKSLSFSSFQNEKYLIERQNHQLEVWYKSLRHYLGLLTQDFKSLCESSRKSPVMECFFPNRLNCTKYFRECNYFTLCDEWPNPLKYCNRIIDGFKREFWKPLEQENIKIVLNKKGD